MAALFAIGCAHGPQRATNEEALHFRRALEAVGLRFGRHTVRIDPRPFRAEASFNLARDQLVTDPSLTASRRHVSAELGLDLADWFEVAECGQYSGPQLLPIPDSVQVEMAPCRGVPTVPVLIVSTPVAAQDGDRLQVQLVGDGAWKVWTVSFGASGQVQVALVEAYFQRE